MGKRTDIPAPFRHELDLQRKQFVREVGRGFEELIERGVDPTPWTVAVLKTLEAVKDAAPEQLRKAA